MKTLAVALSFLIHPQRRRNFLVLLRLLGIFMVLVATYTVVFHVLMEREGQNHSWLTGVYWTFVVMSTLGFGDITFQSDPGRIFSIVVLITGTVFMLVLLPFMFIQFLYVPWMEAQSATRAPRELSSRVRGHVIFTSLSAVEHSLIKRLERSHIDYVTIVPDLTEALLLHDQGFRVMVGEFGELLIAEASVANTPLIGRSLRQIQLRQHANVSVVGIWDRGKFQLADPDTVIQPTSVLILAGSRAQFDAYDSLFCIYCGSEAPVVIIGGGRVGRAIAAALAQQGIDYRIVEQLPERIRDPEKYVLGDAADLEVLQRAGIRESSSVVITTHNDDMNVYLTIYCRRLRPDIQILARANQERNVSTLHRAGADSVLSYATTGASIIYNMLKRSSILLLAEGLDVIRMPVPESLAGKTLLNSGIRERTGCNVIAVVRGGQYEVNPDANLPVPHDADLIIIGSVDSEEKFLQEFS